MQIPVAESVGVFGCVFCACCALVRLRPLMMPFSNQACAATTLAPALTLEVVFLHSIATSARGHVMSEERGSREPGRNGRSNKYFVVESQLHAQALRPSEVFVLAKVWQ
jgi:hypothetical protein